MSRLPSAMKNLVVTTAVASLIPVALFAQTVTGAVKEQSSGAPLSGAAVMLFDAKKKLKAAVRTDADGMYRIVAATPGIYSLSVQKSGLTTAEVTRFELAADSVLVLNFAVSMTAARLATVTVEAKPIVNTSGPNKSKYDLFLLRRNLGMGTFLTREQIEAKPATHTYQLFQNIPGIKISQNGTQWIIRSQRCPAKLPTGGPPPDLDKDNPDLPILFIDGFRVRGLGTMNMLRPGDIEAIEVYQGAAQLPAEAKGNACAAIFLWLKQRR